MEGQRFDFVDQAGLASSSADWHSRSSNTSTRSVPPNTTCWAAEPLVKSRTGTYQWDNRVSPRNSIRGEYSMTTSSADAGAAQALSRVSACGSRVKACWVERDTVASGLDFGLATDRFPLDQAFRLQHDQYVTQGYMDSHPSHWR